MTPTDNKCTALLGEYGPEECGCVCQLPKGHEGNHQAYGDKGKAHGGKWFLTWETDGTHICQGCGKVIGLWNKEDSCSFSAIALEGSNETIFTGGGCACDECGGYGNTFVRPEGETVIDNNVESLEVTCPVCKGTGLKQKVET